MVEPLLQRVEARDYDMLLAQSKRINVKKGDFVFKERDPANYLYFIHRGEVRIFKNVAEDKEIAIFTRSEQDAFGESGIFSGERYSNSAQATESSVVYCIEKEKIESILSKNGALGLHFSRWLAESLEASNAKIRDYVSFGSEGAVASVFVRYSNMYGIVTPDGIQIKEPIMLKEIGNQIGISRETVSRIVNKWKMEGILENHNKIFKIKDISYFRRLLVCEQCGVENCVL